MARSAAARARHGVATNGNITRPKRETGQYGNTKPRDDAHVRRARRMETDGRLKAAKADQEAHERKLAELDRKLSGQVHVPYQPPMLVVVPEPEPEPEENKVPAKQRIATSKVETEVVDVARARELIGQGYHVEYVIKRTGVPVEMLKNLVGSDGYRRGGS